MMMFAIREQIQGGHLLKAVFDSKEAVSDKPAGATQHSDQSFSKLGVLYLFTSYKCILMGHRYLRHVDAINAIKFVD